MARFSFHRGSLALDFVGTVGRRASTFEERLPDPAALAAWLEAAELVAPGPPATDADLAEARRLREAIARIVTAAISASEPAAADIALLNAAARAAAAPALDEAGMRRVWRGDRPVRGALGRVAQDAIDTVALRRAMLVRCELPACGSFLLDTARGPRRRWCSMETCGNSAKVAAHRARRKAQTSS